MSLSNETFRREYAVKSIKQRLLKTLVSEGISRKLNWGAKYIDSPYLGSATANSGSIDGTYSLGTLGTTDDRLTVDTQVDASAHLFAFEQSLTDLDVYTGFVDELTDAVAEKVDSVVINKYIAGAGSINTDFVGGITLSNVAAFFASVRKIGAGYRAIGKHYVILTEDEVSIVMQWAGSQGFNFGDAVLKNGEVAEIFGVKIFVVLKSQYTTSTDRLAGVIGTNSYLIDDAMAFEEKGVSEKTGKEMAVVVNVGAKVWTPKAALTVEYNFA